VKFETGFFDIGVLLMNYVPMVRPRQGYDLCLRLGSDCKRVPCLNISVWEDLNTQAVLVYDNLLQSLADSSD